MREVVWLSISLHVCGLVGSYSGGGHKGSMQVYPCLRVLCLSKWHGSLLGSRWCPGVWLRELPIWSAWRPGLWVWKPENPT